MQVLKNIRSLHEIVKLKDFGSFTLKKDSIEKMDRYPWGCGVGAPDGGPQ